MLADSLYADTLSWVAVGLAGVSILAYFFWLLRYGERLGLDGQVYRPSRKPLLWWLRRRP